MKIKHNSKTGETTIRLSRLETKQFLSSNEARVEVANAIKRAVAMTKTI